MTGIVSTRRDTAPGGRLGALFTPRRVLVVGGLRSPGMPGAALSPTRSTSREAGDAQPDQ